MCPSFYVEIALTVLSNNKNSPPYLSTQHIDKIIQNPINNPNRMGIPFPAHRSARLFLIKNTT